MAASDGPVLSLINKRLRSLCKKLNRITQMEESLSQGKALNKEQEEVLRSKPSIIAAINELDKLCKPLSSAISEEINLAIQCHQVSTEIIILILDNGEPEEEQKAVEGNNQVQQDLDVVIEDLLNLIYFGSMFDAKTPNDFTMLTRTHERGCCLAYDYVSDDDATDPLIERDLDLISMVGSLLTSRPVNSSLSHKNALQKCVENAKLWLSNSDNPIESDSSVTYAGLREKLAKIMSSNYFTTSPQMKGPGEMAAAAAGNYGSFHVTDNLLADQVEGLDAQYQRKEEGASIFPGNESYDDNEPGHDEEPYKVETSDYSPAQSEFIRQQPEGEQNSRYVELKEQQYIPRSPYQNQRGGRGGGGRRGYVNGHGSRTGGGRGGVPYQNGHSQYHDQPWNYHPRNYHNNRGRGRGGGGRGAGVNSYNQHDSAVQVDR